MSRALGYCLDLDFGYVAELHGRQLELGAVAVELPQAWFAHATPPSVG